MTLSRQLVHTALIASAALVMAPSLASAKTVCGPAGAERIVEVVALETGKKVPCEVRYTKHGGEAKSIFQAKVQEGYCESKASEFVEKLKKDGMECKDE